MRIKTRKPDSGWLRRGRESGFTLRTGDPAFLPLKRILLNIGGWSVCVPFKETDLEKIIQRGKRFPGRSKTMKGEPCQCHANSASCWEQNRELCKICTGYALTRDGMWRQHSWVFTNNGVVVETTQKRVQYFGFILTEKECESFLENNW
jgi:hypothetical protein